MARTREKVVFEVTHSFNGERPAEEVFADAFIAHLEALSRLNHQADTFDGSEFAEYNYETTAKEAIADGTTA